MAALDVEVAGDVGACPFCPVVLAASTSCDVELGVTAAAAAAAALAPVSLTPLRVLRQISSSDGILPLLA